MKSATRLLVAGLVIMTTAYFSRQPHMCYMQCLGSKRVILEFPTVVYPVFVVFWYCSHSWCSHDWQSQSLL